MEESQVKRRRARSVNVNVLQKQEPNLAHGKRVNQSQPNTGRACQRRRRVNQFSISRKSFFPNNLPRITKADTGLQMERKTGFAMNVQKDFIEVYLTRQE